MIQKLKENQKIWLVLLICFTIVGGLLLKTSFAVREPIKSVTITSKNVSYEKKESGSWNIVKSAKWIEKGKAQIIFDVDTVVKTEKINTDIILVLDVSGSMDGEKLTRVKEDATDLVDTLLSDDQNHAALISFESNSRIIENLTNDKDKMIEQINNLTTTGCTNYYQAFKNVEEILKNYQKQENREMIILFLTDGYPNEETPNEIGEYQYLKSEYPDVTINGIQYEMGEDVLDPIKKVSDNQFIADMDSLNNILFEASITPIEYDDFTITDYINDEYFDIESIDEVYASIGDVKLEYERNTPKVIWNINNFKSGRKASMTINVTLKDKVSADDLYPTNEKEMIESSIPDNKDEKVTSTETPILSANYLVSYEANAPEGCTVKNIPNQEKHIVFDTVNISNQKPVCEGYQFKGWEIITKDVKKVNQDTFIMPGEDVAIRATWSSLSLVKSMDGKISNAQTLYSTMANNSVIDTGVVYNQLREDGIFEFSKTKDDKFPVYYYRGNVTNNNLKFANICWKMVRTTSTGGVKVIYNGLPDQNGNCTATAGAIGNSQFNTPAGGGYSDSLAFAGYMYGTPYYVKERTYNGHSQSVLIDRELKIDYYYGDDIQWNGEKYNLSSLKKIESDTNLNDLVGKYTFLNSNEDYTNSSIYYIAKVSNKTMYGIQLQNGNDLNYYNKQTIIFGEKIEKVENGYQLVNTVEIPLEDWYLNYDKVQNQIKIGLYTCNSSSNICQRPSFVTNVLSSGSGYFEDNIDNYKFGNGFEYKNGNYVLKNTKSVDNWILAYNELNDYHYTCFNNNGICSTVNYIIYTRNKQASYISIEKGKSIEDAIKDMETNEQDSTVKKIIDEWYSNHLTDYTKYLEDTVWCNDRSKYELNGSWNPNNADVTKRIKYNASARALAPSLSCEINDAFTVNEENGNGKLIYPTALLTEDELELAGHWGNLSKKTYLWSTTTSDFWSLTPYEFGGSNQVASYGGTYYTTESFMYGIRYSKPIDSSLAVRPAISLRKGLKVYKGNGTATNPYVLELE